MLTDKQTRERYNLSLEEWKALTVTQKSGRRKNYNEQTRALCECGEPATVVVCNERICQNCASIQAKRNDDRRFNGGSQGETSGHPGITVEYTFQSSKKSTQISTY